MNIQRCMDCEEYLPIDVFKGYCGLKGEVESENGTNCTQWKHAKKCNTGK